MPKSILKTPQDLLNSSSPVRPVRSHEERNRESALYHANIIQQRKNIEATVSASIEALLELPSSKSADPKCPSTIDIAQVKDSLRIFQPSDYDDLIEERNINRFCGYVLCPRQNRQQETQAHYRILRGKGADAMKIVSTKSLEKWCSDDCGKRALYIKVQLNEEPAWTRANITKAAIDILDDDYDQRNSQLSPADLEKSMKNLSVGGEEGDIIEKMRSLAIERGQMDNSGQPGTIERITVHDRSTSDVPEPAPFHADTPGNASDAHGSIEGHVPRL